MNTVKIVRGCGCVMDMPLKDGQSPAHRAAKRARWERTRCPACGEKFSREHDKKYMNPVKLLPVGTFIALRHNETEWSGGLLVNGTKIELAAPTLGKLIAKLALQWCVQTGIKLGGTS